MAILSALGAEGVSRAIALGDWNAVKAAKGIGPKTAQRVVNELKDKAPGVMAMGGTLPTAMGETSADVIEVISAPVSQNTSAEADALSALGNLGYAPGDAAAAVADVGQDHPEADVSTLIREALKRLAPKG
jgi:Holliday junction DNA helicase RuvA